MAIAAHYCFFCAVSGKQHPHQETLRSNRTIHRKRPLHWHRVDAAFSNKHNFYFCANSLRWVLFDIALKPHIKLRKKPSAETLT